LRSGQQQVNIYRCMIIVSLIFQYICWYCN